MGKQKELWWALAGLWAWLLCDPAVGAAIPVTTEWPVTEDDFTTSILLSSEDYFDPTMPVNTEEEFVFTTQSTVPVDTEKMSGENTDAVGEEILPSPGGTSNSELASNIHDVDSVTDTPTKMEVTQSGENLKETTETNVAEKNRLTQANSANPSLEKGIITRDPEVDSKESATAVVLLSKEISTPDLDQQATELITKEFSGVTNPPATPFATKDEKLLATPSGEKAQDAVSSGRSSEDLDQGNPLNLTPASQDETEASSKEWVDLSSNTILPPSYSEELLDQDPGESLANGSSPSLPPKGSAVTSQQKPSSDLLSPTDATYDSSDSDLVKGSLQPSTSSLANLGVESGPTGGRGDADMTPSSSGPELSQKDTTEEPLREAEVPTDDEASNSSPSIGTTDAPSDSVSPYETPFVSSELGSDGTGIPPVGFSIAPGFSSQLPEESEAGSASKTEEIEESSRNLNSSEGRSFTPPLPSQETARGTETPDREDVSADLHGGTTSSLNPGVETSSSELEDNEPTAVTNSPLKGKINPTSSDSEAVTENDSATLLNIRLTSPPPVDNEGAGLAQGTPAETSALGSPNETSSERGDEVSPSGSPGNIGSSSEDNEAVPSVSSVSDTNELVTPGNSEDQSGTKPPPPDTELLPISSTPLPMRRSGALDDGLSPTQSLEENALTSISSSSSGGGPKFPSKSPDEAVSSPLVSDTNTAELSSNPLPGSPPSSPKPSENGTEAGSEEPEDSAAIRGEDSSSAPPVETSQPALSGTETVEGSSDVGNEATLSPKKEGTGVTSEPPVNEKPTSDSDHVQDKINTPSSEQQLVSESATDASAVVPAGKAGTISPIIADTEISEKAQEPSGEISSSASIEGTLTSSEKEDGEPSPSQSSKALDSSQNSEVAEGSRDGTVSPGSAAADKIAVTISDEGQLGNDLPVPDTELGPTKVADVPVGELATSPLGEKPALAPADGETFGTNTASGQESPSAPPNAKPSPFFASDLAGVQPSGPSASPGSSQLSPDDALKAGPAAQSLDLKDLAGKTGQATDLTPSAPELLSSETAESSVSPSVPREGAELSPDDAPKAGAASSAEGGEAGAISQSAKSESGTSTGSQPSPDDASTEEVHGSGTKAVEDTSVTSEEKLSLPSSAKESQSPGISDEKEISGGHGDGKTSLPNEELQMAGSGSSNKSGAQPSPAGAATEESAISGGEEQLENSSVDEKEAHPSATGPAAPGTPADSEVSGRLSGGDRVEIANTEPANNAEPQLTSDNAGPASEEREISKLSSVSEEKGSLAASAAESQATSSSKEAVGTDNPEGASEPGELETGESSLPTGVETAQSGSQPSLDILATEGTIASEGAEISKDNSIVREKKIPLTPSSIESQSPEASVGKEVSEKLANGESTLSTDGRKDTANIGPAGAQASTSSTGTGLNQENTAEHLGEKSDSISGGDLSPQTSSVDEDGAKISKPSGGNLISSSISTDGNLATKETNQDSGFTGSSPPPSGSKGINSNFENPVNTGNAEHALLPVSGQSVLSNSDTSGGSDAKPGAEILPGGSGSGPEALDSARDSNQPSAEGSKPAAEAAASPIGPLSPNDVLPLKSSDSGTANPENGVAGGLSPNGLPGSAGGPDVKNGEGLSPTSPEGRVDAESSSSTAKQGKPTASASGKAQPSLLGTKPSPTGTPQLLAEKTKPQVKADSTSPPSKVGVPASVEHPLLGKLLPSGPIAANAIKSEQLQAFIKSKIEFGLSKAKISKAKLDFLLAKKFSKSTSKKPGKKSDSDSDSNSKESEDENAVQLGMISAPSGAAVSLYPYGANVNDKQYIERKVDFNSPLFEPEIGVPLGNELRKSLYFTDNGQIIFPASNKDIHSYPNPPPNGFNGREKVPVVAVFWDNADFSQGTGTIFYQEYISQNSPKHPLVQDVEAKIRQYVKSSYSARWTLKVTWVKAQPYPVQRKNCQTNTYQAILTTDGYRTYALFLYQDGGMLWNPTKLSATNVLIGYTSGDGYFKNDNLMKKTPTEKYRPDHFQGYNTDLRGLWIYKLDSRIRVNYRQRCLDWIGHEGLPSAWNKALPPCPCSLQQGVADNRYLLSKKGAQDSFVTLLYSASPNKFGAGVRCLYNQNNQLVEGRQERIWKDSRKNSLNNDEELKFYDWCCNQAESPQLCNKYNQKRPKIGCQGYQPPIQAEETSEEKSHRNRRG